MPDEKGQLSEEQIDKLTEHLNRLGKVGKCPVCGSSDFGVGHQLVYAPVYTPGKLIVGGPTFPLAFAACTKCHFVEFFFAAPIGLLSQPDKKKEPAKEEKSNG